MPRTSDRILSFLSKWTEEKLVYPCQEIATQLRLDMLQRGLNRKQVAGQRVSKVLRACRVALWQRKPREEKE